MNSRTDLVLAVPGRHGVVRSDCLLSRNIAKAFFLLGKDQDSFEVKGGIRIAAKEMIVYAPLVPARPHDGQFTDDLLAGMPAGTIGLADKVFLDEEKHDWLLPIPSKNVYIHTCQSNILNL